MSTAIVWFRQDLRLADNPIITNALTQFDRVVLLYIHAPDEAGKWPPGSASKWWLHHSLVSLQSDIEKLRGKLVVRTGRSLEQIQEIISATGAEAIFLNRVYEPSLVRRDREVVAALKRMGVKCHIYNHSLLFNPETVLTQSGSSYKVFTPFWNSCQSLLNLHEQPVAPPVDLGASNFPLKSLPFEKLNLLSELGWQQKLESNWLPGELPARKKLDEFISQRLIDYHGMRDRPDVDATSLLSASLHFGELSPRQVLWSLQYSEQSSEVGIVKSRETFIKEIVWREFAIYILHHSPRIVTKPLDPRYADFPYQRKNQLLRAWQTGNTGYPLVDAGMRQLWSTGTMHNRVRMIVASFLTKNALLSWQTGARWFWDTLVDADLANNIFNWQWVAGCGADAAPFFRIFNPVTQSCKFDPRANYIKRWIPELAKLPVQFAHEPWKAPLAVQYDCQCIIGKHYPAPILDLKQTRQQALDLYRRHVKS